jgi:hypothetical protein
MMVNSVVDDGRCGDALGRTTDGRAAVMQATLGSRARQEAVVERSYWHPNGYLKLVLAGGSGITQLRLHVWASTEVADDVHDHAWLYRSQVLTGSVRELRYRETAVASGPLWWRHRYQPVGLGRFALKTPSEVGLACVSVDDRGPHDMSGGDAVRIHRLFAIEVPAITMLSIGPAMRRYSHVYRSNAAADSAILPRPTCRTEVAGWIEHALATLSR